MQKIAIIFLSIILLSGCDLFNSNSSDSVELPPGADPSAQLVWRNIQVAADGVIDVTPPCTEVIDGQYNCEPLLAEHYMNLSKIKASAESVCVVTWQEAKVYTANCGNLALVGGTWPVLANSVSLPEYMLAAFGGTRPFTADEMALKDSIVQETYCTAERVDGSGNPCQVL